MDQPKLILASASPRRQSFLSELGVEFQSVAAEIDETPLEDEPAGELALRLAQSKAETVAGRLQMEKSAPGQRCTDSPASADRPPPLVLGADTVVAVDSEILGKPATHTEARAMLKTLRNRTHQVYSAIALFCLDPSAPLLLGRRLSVSHVTMREYDRLEIERYIESGDPMDKAGAYAIQSRDFAPVASLEGCAAGVMGLPLADLIDLFSIASLSINRPLPPICRVACGRICCQEKNPVRIDSLRSD